MKPILRYASAVLAAASAAMIAAPAAPAQAAPSFASAGETITFDQYRDWRMQFIEQRQTQIAARLADKELTPTRRQSLERQKGYYDYFAAMDPAERDRRFHQRFDRIDSNHDGIIDASERAAWHDRQRSYYDRGSRRPVSTGDLPPR